MKVGDLVKIKMNNLMNNRIGFICEIRTWRNAFDRSIIEGVECKVYMNNGKSHLIDGNYMEVISESR